MDVFDVIGDPTRRAILDLLRAGPMSAGAIADAFSVSRPAISRHLRQLRDADAVVVETRGRARMYHLHPGWQKPIQNWLRGFEPPLTEAMIDAFETEAYRTRRDVRAGHANLSYMEEQTA